MPPASPQPPVAWQAAPVQQPQGMPLAAQMAPYTMMQAAVSAPPYGFVSYPAGMQMHVQMQMQQQMQQHMQLQQQQMQLQLHQHQQLYQHPQLQGTSPQPHPPPPPLRPAAMPGPASGAAVASSSRGAPYSAGAADAASARFHPDWSPSSGPGTCSAPLHCWWRGGGLPRRQARALHAGGGLVLRVLGAPLAGAPMRRRPPSDTRVPRATPSPLQHTLTLQAHSRLFPCLPAPARRHGCAAPSAGARAGQRRTALDGRQQQRQGRSRAAGSGLLPSPRSAQRLVCGGVRHRAAGWLVCGGVRGHGSSQGGTARADEQQAHMLQLHARDPLARWLSWVPLILVDRWLSWVPLILVDRWLSWVQAWTSLMPPLSAWGRCSGGRPPVSRCQRSSWQTACGGWTAASWRRC